MKWISFFLILSLIGCAGQFYEYKYKMVEPIENNKLQYEDESINIIFRIGLRDVSFTILNKLNKPITLLYDQAVYVDQFNLAHDTTHSTLSLLTFGEHSPPKVIPPKTELLNYFAPIEKIESIRGWKVFILVEPFVREVKSTNTWVRKKGKEQLDKQAKSNVGKIIGVFLPIEIDGKVRNYFFKFEIIDALIPERGGCLFGR